MEFYYDELKKSRISKRFTVNNLVKKAGISRASLWAWENGKRKPSEIQIRNLAHVLDIPLNIISDLKSEYPLSETDLSDQAQTWINFIENKKEHIQQKNKFVSWLDSVQNEMDQISTIIKALLSTIEIYFYIKDINSKYITANNKFLNQFTNNNLNNILINKTDFDFFPEKEAKNNLILDQNVLMTGEAIVEKEAYIPGTRKKQTGLISKYPIFDSNNKIMGLVCTIYDITEKKKAEDEFRMLYHAINNANTVTWIVERFDINNIHYYKSLFISDSVEKVFGYPKEKYLTDPMFYVQNNILPEDRKKLFEIRTKLSKLKNLEKVPFTEHFKVITNTKEIKWIESTVTEIKYNSKKYYIFLERDVTEKERQKRTSLEIAVKLYNKNISTDIIRETTGVTLKELKNKLFLV